MPNIIKSIIKKKIANAFDVWSPTYSDDVIPKLSRRGYSYKKLSEIILSHLEPKLNSMVLEIGVGTGVLGKEVVAQRTDLNVLGCDISRGMLVQSRQIGLYESLFQCDAEGTIPFRSGSLEYVYSAFMAHSAMNMKTFFHELRRILKTNNDTTVVIVDLFRTKRTLPIVSKLVDNFHSFKYEHGAFSNYRTVDKFVGDAKKSGFTVEYVSPLDSSDSITRASAGKMAHYILKLNHTL